MEEWVKPRIISAVFSCAQGLLCEEVQVESPPVVPLPYQSQHDPLPQLAGAICWGALVYCAGLAVYMTFHGMWKAAQVRLGLGRSDFEMLLLTVGGEALCAAAALAVAVSAALVLRGSRTWLRILILALWGVILVRVSTQLVELNAAVSEMSRVTGTFGAMGSAGLIGVHLSGVVLVSITPGLLIALLTRPAIHGALVPPD